MIDNGKWKRGVREGDMKCISLAIETREEGRERGRRG